MSTEGVARAAYRLGLVEATLKCVESGELEMPGIYREVLRGEREFRLQELDEQGVSTDAVLKDMRLKVKS